jgi:hypothetical protein
MPGHSDRIAIGVQEVPQRVARRAGLLLSRESDERLGLDAPIGAVTLHVIVQLAERRLTSTLFRQFLGPTE